MAGMAGMSAMPAGMHAALPTMPGMQAMPNMPGTMMPPQQIITSGTHRDCIRMRGLPFEATVQDILTFLGELSRNITFQGVHMVYNAQVSLTCPLNFLDFLIWYS